MTGLPARFPLQVQMVSDWIVGTGESRAGDADATVRRDHDGLPFLPAKSLTGIMRDACEQVAAWLAVSGDESGGAGRWALWVDWLFGSQPDASGDRGAASGEAPRRATLALSPARMPRALREACRNRPALLTAAVTMRPGVEIDDASGVAADDTLRLEERARPGTLEAQAEFPFLDGSEVPSAAEFLLRAGAAVVDGLGGKRNRGGGRCWILLPGTEPLAGDPPVPADARPADARLAELAADSSLIADPGVPPTLTEPAAWLTTPAPEAPHPASPGQAGPEARTWRVILRLITPLVSQTRVLGNVTMSRDWVPGTVLLPVILRRLSRPVGHAEVVVGDARPAAITASGVVPGLPVPMTWYRGKDRDNPDVVNAAVRVIGAQERRSAMRSGHVAAGGDGTWMLTDPEMHVSTHAVIGDQTGRPDADRGGVFSYVGIAPGTLLASDITLPAQVRLALKAGEMLRLGRSRKDDFGLAEVVDVREVPAPARAAVTGDVLAWCVSDVLLRDAWGASSPSPDALAGALTGLLGTAVLAVPREPGGLVTSAYRAARRESFHTRWGRPRPTLSGLAAGSVITLRFSGEVPGEELSRIERDGIGERTAEGFGRLRFGAPELTARQPVLIPAAGSRPETPGAGPGGAADQDGDPGDSLPGVPHILEVEAARAEIARRVARIVVDPAEMDRVIPGASGTSSRAQWGSLREQLALLGSESGRESAARWLAQTRDVRQRRLAWGMPALDALERLLTAPGVAWSALGLDGDALNDCVLGPGRLDRLREALWPEAVTVLLSGIARAATRRLQAAESREEQ